MSENLAIKQNSKEDTRFLSANLLPWFCIAPGVTPLSKCSNNRLPDKCAPSSECVMSCVCSISLHPKTKDNGERLLRNEANYFLGGLFLISQIVATTKRRRYIICFRNQPNKPNKNKHKAPKCYSSNRPGWRELSLSKICIY